MADARTCVDRKIAGQLNDYLRAASELALNGRSEKVQSIMLTVPAAPLRPSRPILWMIAARTDAIETRVQLLFEYLHMPQGTNYDGVMLILNLHLASRPMTL